MLTELENSEHKANKVNQSGRKQIKQGKGRLMASLAAVFVAGAVTAQEVAVPQGCEPVVSIRKQSCVVTTVFDCGNRFEEHGYIRGELSHTHVFDKGWAFAGYRLKNNVQTVDIDFTEGHSITLEKLLTDGTATGERDASVGTGRLRGLEYRLLSRADMTDETVDLSGHRFRKVRMHRSFVRKQGDNQLDFDFEIFVSEELNLFIEGSYSRKTKGRDAEWLDQGPLALSFAGEPGFMATGHKGACDG